MSLAIWIRNLRESMNQKKNAKVQIRSGAVSPMGSFHESQVWNGAVAIERSTSSSAVGTTMNGGFLSGTASGSASPAPSTSSAPTAMAPASSGVPSTRGSTVANGSGSNRSAEVPAPRAGFQLPDPPGFQDSGLGSIRYLADIPREMRERIQQEGMARAFRRLETPLRALNMATSRKGTSYPAEEMRGFLIMWRQALADYMGLLPDDRSVLVYERSVDEAYFVRGRCTIGAHLSVIEPCWRLNGEVVVRGEAQVVQGWVR